MSHLREEHVAGVLDAVDHIERSMLSRVDPAAQRRCDLLVDTGTVHRIIQPDSSRAATAMIGLKVDPGAFCACVALLKSGRD